MILATWGPVRAQSSPLCAPLEESIDPITKEKKVVFRSAKRDGVWLVLVGHALHVELNVKTAEVASIPEGAPITLLFEDHSTMVLTEAMGNVSDVPIAQYYPWTLDCIADLSFSQLAVLAQNQIKLIRYALRDFDFDVEVKPSDAAKIKAIAQCMMSRLPPR